jgi:fluoride ion exporter CrcB/FEX
MIDGGVLTVWAGLGAGLLGGLTTLAAFLAVSRLLRSPEMREVLTR